jgi:hypothetical protein
VILDRTRQGDGKSVMRGLNPGGAAPSELRPGIRRADIPFLSILSIPFIPANIPLPALTRNTAQSGFQAFAPFLAQWKAIRHIGLDAGEPGQIPFGSLG